MLSRIVAVGLCVLLARPSLVAAQQVAEGPPKVQDIRAVERGFFIQTDIGLSWMISKLDDRSFAPGIAAGVYLGYDVLPFLSLAVGGMALAASGSEDNAPRGDLLFLSPMVQVQFAFIATERDFLYVRGGGGFAFGVPEQVNGADFGGNGPAFNALVGYEHFTRLRHFSIGVAAGVVGVTKPAFGIGLALLPTLKYTF